MNYKAYTFIITNGEDQERYRFRGKTYHSKDILQGLLWGAYDELMERNGRIEHTEEETAGLLFDREYIWELEAKDNPQGTLRLSL